jgi:hypothetical protein
MQPSTFQLFVVFAILAGINAYVFLASPRSLQTVARAAQAAATKAAPPLPEPAPARPLVVRQGTVRDREGLGSALRRDGVAAADVDRALRALGPLIDFRRQIHAGQRYRFALDGAGALAALELRAGGQVYAVARAPDGRLLGAKGLASRVR